MSARIIEAPSGNRVNRNTQQLGFYWCYFEYAIARVFTFFALCKQTHLIRTIFWFRRALALCDFTRIQSSRLRFQRSLWKASKERIGSGKLAMCPLVDTTSVPFFAQFTWDMCRELVAFSVLDNLLNTNFVADSVLIVLHPNAITRITKIVWMYLLIRILQFSNCYSVLKSPKTSSLTTPPIYFWQRFSFFGIECTELFKYSSNSNRFIVPLRILHIFLSTGFAYTFSLILFNLFARIYSIKTVDSRSSWWKSILSRLHHAFHDISSAGWFHILIFFRRRFVCGTCSQ